MKVIPQRVEIKRASVTVCCGDEDVLAWDAGYLAGFLPRLIGNFLRQSDEVAEHQRRLSIALVKEDCLGTEWIMDARADTLIKIAA
jgi:hypothetical protein